MNTFLSSLIRAYFFHVPDHPGKWRLWTIARPRLRAGYFKAGIYSTSMGLKMLLTPEQYIDLFIYYWGVWEPDETYFVRKFLRPKDRFVDIGANAGYFSLLAANIVGNDGQVDAFEPVPRTAQLLRENIARNGLTNVRVHECAVSREEGSVFISRQGVGEVSGQNSMRVKPGEGKEGWDVPTRRLDQALSGLPPIRLIKIDIEGAELLALSGASQLLADENAPAVLCEVTDSYLRELNSSESELFELMERHGYAHVYDIHNRQLRLLTPAEQKSPSFQRNLVFSKQLL